LNKNISKKFQKRMMQRTYLRIVGSFLCYNDESTVLNTQKEKAEEYWIFDQKCSLLLQEDEIRFAGLINSMGRLVAGGFKEGITPIEDEAERQKMYMELALRVSMRKDFDYSLGSVKYTASRREKAVMMSFPINSNVMLVSAEPTIDIDKLANKIMKIIGLK
jgi:hypothetical protein